jgi:SAM-dependent methyltransferase
MAFLAALEVALAVTSRRVLPVLTGLFILAFLGFYLYTTLRGKFVVWAELLDQLNLRGDERILDLGCGRGAVLLMAAQHLTTGRAVGVDLWRSVDQSGNSAEATRRNAIAEGVADRVELHTADMTALPLEGSSFDLVVSSLAIHNIRGHAGREKAISEAVRVLRPADDHRRSGHATIPGTACQARDEGCCPSSAGMALLAPNPSRDGYEAGTSDVRRPVPFP